MSNLRHRWKSLLTLLTLVVLVGIMFAVRAQLRETFENLRHVNLWPVLLIAPLALANHYFHGQLYRGMLAILGHSFKSKLMTRMSLELNLVNNVFPSGGVSGFSYLSMRLKKQGVSTAQATLVQIMRFGLLFVSFQILLAMGLLALAFSGNANNFVMLVAGSLFTLMLIATGGGAFIIGSRHRINVFFTWLTKLINRLIHVVRPRHPETINIERAKRAFTELHDNYVLIRNDLSRLRGPLISAMLVSLSEIVAIYAVFVAFGHWINPGAIIIAYAVANFAGFISVLPGGVGVYEGLMTGVFAAAGVSAALSLPVIVTFRVISMLVQLPVGYYFYQRFLNRKQSA